MDFSSTLLETSETMSVIEICSLALLFGASGGRALFLSWRSLAWGWDNLLVYTANRMKCPALKPEIS